MGRSSVYRNAGRKKRWNEDTCVIRLPVSLAEVIKRHMNENCFRIPFYADKEKNILKHDEFANINLHDLLITDPSSDFLFKVERESMIDAGIYPGDILIANASIEPEDGKIVVCQYENNMVVKRYFKKGNMVQLIPDNDAFKAVEIKEDEFVKIWGVVTQVIHKLDE